MSTACLVDHGSNLGNAVLGDANVRPGCHTPAGSHDLETSCSGFELAPGCRADRRFIVGLKPKEITVTAGDSDRRSGREDTWASNELTLDCVTQPKGHAAPTSQVADGGDAGPERLSGRRDSAQE